MGILVFVMTGILAVNAGKDDLWQCEGCSVGSDYFERPNDDLTGLHPVQAPMYTIRVGDKNMRACSETCIDDAEVMLLIMKLPHSDLCFDYHTWKHYNGQVLTVDNG